MDPGILIRRLIKDRIKKLTKIGDEGVSDENSRESKNEGGIYI